MAAGARHLQPLVALVMDQRNELRANAAVRGRSVSIARPDRGRSSKRIGEADTLAKQPPHMEFPDNVEQAILAASLILQTATYQEQQVMRDCF